MLHCCINLYITYAIISEKLICFSSFSMQWYLLKIYCMQSKNLWKNSLALLSECCLSNVKKKMRKNNTSGVLSKQAIYFYNHYYRFFTDFFETPCIFEIDRSFPGLFYVVIFQPQSCYQMKTLSILITALSLGKYKFMTEVVFITWSYSVD